MRLQGRNEEAYDRAQRLLEWPMIVLSVVFVVLIIIPLATQVSATGEATLEGVAWFIWALFAGEYLLLLWLAPDRWEMVRTHKLDLLIVLLPFLRPLRIARALRMLRAAVPIMRAAVGVRRLFGRRGFTPFLAIVGAVIATCGLAVWMVERDVPGAEIVTLTDGLWWAIVTSTTVGYGDMVPVTDPGRGIATLLLLVGVALFSVVTANIAAFFVEEGPDDSEQSRHLLERLERIEELLRDERAEVPGSG